MIFEDVDLSLELKKEKERQGTDAVLKEALALIEADEQDEALIWNSLKHNPKAPFTQKVSPQNLSSSRIFDEQTVGSICTQYRLRFLESRLFQGEIPREAVDAIKDFKRQHGFLPVKYHIIAPASRFLLRDCTKDPLLLADLGNQQYYLMHAWGNDMAWHRKLLMFPFRNITSMAFTIAILGLFLTTLMPTEYLIAGLGNNGHIPLLIHVFFFSVVSGCIFTTALIFGIMSSKDFSENVWNSQFFN